MGAARVIAPTRTQKVCRLHCLSRPWPLLTPHETANGDDAEVDEATVAFDELALKKKKKSKKPKDEVAVAPDDDEAPAQDADFDAAALKKKKKKKAPKADDFEAKLAEAEAADEDDAAATGEATTTSAAAAADVEGDMEEGTGVWAHDSSAPINYDLLLGRFFQLLNAHNPDLMSSGLKTHKIPPPQCLREGNKKTIFANLPEICRRMKRSEEHVTQFLFAELGTYGSTDGSRRLVIKGKFLQKQIENVLRRYISELCLSTRGCHGALMY